MCAPSRGLLCDCEIFANLRLTFVLSSNLQEAHFRWSQAALLVECGHGQLVEAVSLWSRLGEAAQDHQARLGLGARTRSNLVAAMQVGCCQHCDMDW